MTWAGLRDGPRVPSSPVGGNHEDHQPGYPRPGLVPGRCARVSDRTFGHGDVGYG